MLQHHAPQEHPTPPARAVELLQAFREILTREGMASIDEYGDLLKWGLPKQEGMGCAFHVFHPDFCSYSDAYRGTIHYHGGAIRGTVLAGGMEHHTYLATPDADGDRFLDGQAYRLEKTTHPAREGTTYSLPAMVPHWLNPTALTITYFEEEDNDVMGELLEPATKDTDDHAWEQPDVDALLPVLLELIDARIERLSVIA